MRITQRAVALTSLQGLNRNLTAVSKLQEQLTSGKVISAPSDSPTGTNRAMQTRADQAANAQYARNLSDATGWLELTDSTLQEMLTTARKVRDLTVQGSNEGTMSAASRQALATEVASLRDSLLGLANTTNGGRPLFGGITQGATAYDKATGAYVGISGSPIMRRVSATESVRADITGPEAFGPTGNDLFAVVGRIADDLVNDPDVLAADLAALDTAMEAMTTAVADIGARGSRIERESLLNSDVAMTLETRLAQVENVDLADTIMRLEMQKVGYEAALAATAKAISPTLLDYLR